MKKQTIAALALIVFASVPLAAFAAVDKAEIENYCRQEAMEKSIAADKVDGYVADCVAANMKAKAEIQGMEAEEEKAE
jgi:non-ribosomal peptide synthetase component E (peptide arylation enzyme)